MDHPQTAAIRSTLKNYAGTLNDEDLDRAAEALSLLFDSRLIAEKMLTSDAFASGEKAIGSMINPKPTHRHKESGHEVVLLGAGKMQTELWENGLNSGDQSVDMEDVAVYRHGGMLWVRPWAEFHDGRFETLEAANV